MPISHAKIHHVAVFTGKFVKSNVPRISKDGQAKDFSPLESGEDTEVLDIEHNFGPYLRDEAVVSFTGGLFWFRNSLKWRPSSGCKKNPLPIAESSNFRSAERRFSGYMDCFHPVEISVTYLSTPRLMTTHDCNPSPLNESVCTSMPYRP